jgi:uncharacterized protein (TIGR03905 family)
MVNIQNRTYVEKLSGVCSTGVKFVINKGKIYSIEFTGGCSGNLRAIARLADGMDAKEVAGILREVRCGTKLTSCGDQFARAIDRALS